MLPGRQDPRWGALVDDPGHYVITFLALRILLKRLTRNLPLSPADRNAAIDEVHACFVKNERLMSADIASIFG
jgi:hypothetical protein